MSQYKISKKRLAQIIKEEYDAAMLRTDEGHGAFGNANRDDKPKKKRKKEARTDEAHCSSANRDEDELENEEEADLNDDGRLSPYEKTRGKAIEKAMKKESLDSIRTLIQQELKNL